MRVGILTREWPPDIYGGAGIHVEHLVTELRDQADVFVHCFGATRVGAEGHHVPDVLADANPSVRTLGVDLTMVNGVQPVDVVHSHTWYTNLAGHLVGLLQNIPHVITAHSLEPRRPWKEEQLGGGYRISSWIEATAYPAADAIIAVSSGMRNDILACYPRVDPQRVHVVRNGVDTDFYRPDPRTDALRHFGLDPEHPYVLFVGRITRQKGVAHLLRAAHHLDPDTRLVICASSPDTPEIGAETAAAIAELQDQRGSDTVRWIDESVPRSGLVELYSHAQVFICPSVYEPLGIVNLEAMACGTAVVSSDVGGIPEVVVEGVTGLMVHYDRDRTAEFEVGIATAVNRLTRNPDLAAAMGRAGRERAVTDFGWDAIAGQTMAVYQWAREVHAGR